MQRHARRSRPRRRASAVVDWVDERTSLSGAARWLMFRKVPKGTNWFYTLGSATMFAFLSQAVTGRVPRDVLPARPLRRRLRIDPPRHQRSLPRAVRRAGCTSGARRVMVILVFLHMGRTFFFGAYKYPRELNWVIGVVLSILTMLMSFTGYLLPFDQRAYWATIVGVNINGTGPLVGPYLSDFLRGGPEFGATTLSRFYAIHMLLVPGADRGFDRRAPVPGGQARHHRAAMAQGREGARAAQGRGADVNQREKEEYLREYSILKAQGKPFFPYAVGKDALDGVRRDGRASSRCHSCWGPSSGPRPIRPPRPTCPGPSGTSSSSSRSCASSSRPPRPARDDRRAHARDDPAVPAAVLRSRARAPARAPADRDVTGFFVIAAMALLTYQGANAGSPTAIEMATPAARRQGRREDARRSTKPASWSSPSRAASPVTRSARTAMTAPVRS